jgi:hypothetical protein
MGKLIVCIDFDGVIHDYKEGWKDGSIYGNVVDGFFEWAEEAQKDFRLVVYSSRSKVKEDKDEMENWLHNRYLQWKKDEEAKLQLEFSNIKPAAFLTIDDRAIQFKGDWSAQELSIGAMKSFKPYTAK